MRTTSSICVVLLASALASQSSTYLQPNVRTKDAPSLTFLAGLGGDRRQQMVFSATIMQPLSKATLTGISFRRNGGHADALPAVKASLTLHASSARRSWDRVSAVFSQNAGAARVRLFQGAVSAPASAKPGVGYTPWAVSNTLRIPFSTTYFYSAGDLCLDIDGRAAKASAGAFWPLDAVYDGAAGKVESVGKGCGNWQATDGRKSHAEASTLRIGATTRVTCLGRPKCSGIFVMGLNRYSNALNLQFLGAPKCHLYVRPWLQFPVAYQTPWFPTSSAWASVAYHIPPVNTLRGAVTYIQFLDNETSLPRSEWTNAGGLTSGNGLKLTVSGALPSLQVTTTLSHAVDSGAALPIYGRVRMNVAPVVRFDRR